MVCTGQVHRGFPNVGKAMKKDPEVLIPDVNSFFQM